MNILITGATGFVGGNLIKSFGGAHQIKTLGLAHEQTDYKWDSLDAIPLDGIDAYIHLAGKAHDTKNTSDPDSYFQINTGLTEKIFAHFAKSSATKFIAFSSVKAIADTVEGVLTEDAAPSPQTPYGQSKLKAENFIVGHPIKDSQRYIILRPCMIHGPGNKGNLNLLYGVVSKGIPYPLGAFDNSRSFLSIDNLIFAIGRILDSPNIASGAYQVADDEPLSTNDVVSIISATIGKPSRIWNFPKAAMQGLASIGDLARLPINSERLKKLTESYIVSNKKIKQALAIEKMPTSAKDGLRQTIKSFIK